MDKESGGMEHPRTKGSRLLGIIIILLIILFFTTEFFIGERKKK